ncbi:response regulator transcription factor [Oceanobacter mangrovi]|uniref:response regulator transcription factor n=1 Tax=Oceanobacter mangrovi TaxID=2862510 RepID=UPI001C8E515C|nr:response regulator transcription factor [Oceanobacter mangrovi]
MKGPALIYVVEDDADIAQLVCRELQRYSHRVQAFRSGSQLVAALQSRAPDMCIIDLGLPDMDGLGLVRDLTDRQDIGVMILSGRDSLPDRVLGLELGADDYLSKPFDPRELVARTNSILRRVQRPEAVRLVADDDSPRVAHFADWQFDMATLQLQHDDGRQLELSPGEAKLLQQLLLRPRQILSREALMAGKDDGFDRSIDVRMSRIRKKIEEDPKSPRIVKTIYGMGYMLTVDVSW